MTSSYTQWGISTIEANNLKDYFLYKGLSTTSKHFESELKSDRDKTMRVDKLMERIQSSISSSDLNNLIEALSLVQCCDPDIMTCFKRLQTRTFKLYLVTAYLQMRNDKIGEFFSRFSSTFINDPDWKEWFALPYIKNAEETSTFAMYFNKHWIDSLLLSLSNLISLSLSNSTLMNHEDDRRRMEELEEKNASLMEVVRQLRSNLITPETPSNDNEVFNEGSAIKRTSMTDNQKNYSFNAEFISNMGKNKIDFKNNINERNNETQYDEAKNKDNKINNYEPKTNNNSFDNDKTVIGTTNNQTSTKSNQNTQNIGVNIPSSTFKSTSPTKTSFSSLVRSFSGFKDNKSVSKNTPQSVSKNNFKNLNDSKNSPSKCEFYIEDGSLTEGGKVKSSIDAADDKSDLNVVFDAVYTEHTSSITTCKLSPDGGRVASLDQNGGLKLWTTSLTTTSNTTSKLSLSALEWFTTTDRYLILGSKGGVIRLFDSKDRKVVVEVATDAKYQRVVDLSANTNSLQFVASMMGRIGTAIGDMKSGKLSVWSMNDDLKNDTTLDLFPSPVLVTTITHNARGSLLLSGAVDGGVRLFDMRTHKTEIQWPVINRNNNNNSNNIETVSFGSEDNDAFIMSSSGCFSKWDLRSISTSQWEHRFSKSSNVIGYGGKSFVLNSSASHALVAFGKGAHIYKIKSTFSPTSIFQMMTGNDPITCVDWSKDTENNDNIIASTEKGSIKLTMFKGI